MLYNERKVAQYVLNLCELTGNDYCEVQDVRWDPTTERVLFNMACPSYSSEINGRGHAPKSYPGGDYYVLSTPEEFLYVKRDDILIKSKR